MVLIALLVISCDQISEPSALELAERQAEHAALLAEVDARWLSEREIARGEQDHGFLVPTQCEATIARIEARDEVLVQAWLLATGTDSENRREIYDLWEQRIDLLKELDRELDQGCR